MNILFLSLISNLKPFDDNGIYSGLLLELSKKNKIYIVSPLERREKRKTYLEIGNNYQLLNVKTLNIQKTNIIEKGLSTITIQKIYKRAISKYFNKVKFDLILYATPPITFYKVIKYFKKRDNAKTYLMLKDIFPQNAVDLEMFSKKSLIYKYFRNQEIKLYKISDMIGCMSPKNMEYLLKHNNYINKSKVEVFPNSIYVKEKNKRNVKLNDKYREKYNIPTAAKVFIYGGNLGKPQNIPFIVKCLQEVADINNTFFVICGKGTDYKTLDAYQKKYNQKNVLLLNGLSREEYNDFLNIADVGLLFLDYRFTIPNFPSRLLSYLEKGIPVLACTDLSTDIGDIIEKNDFGWKCSSDNPKSLEQKSKK